MLVNLAILLSFIPLIRAWSYTGDMTWGHGGIGSCGRHYTNSCTVVRVAESMMSNVNGTNLHDNPLCGINITIKYQNHQFNATVLDTCKSCLYADINVTPGLFSRMSDLATGRVHGVDWWFLDGDGSRPSLYNK